MTSSLSQQARDQLAKQYLAERAARNPKLTPSITYGNWTTPPGSLVAPVMQSGRGADADQHKQFTGGGYQPQIERV